MFIPLHDRNALTHIRRPYVTYFIIIANALIWAVTSNLGEGSTDTVLLNLAFIPSIGFGDAVIDPSIDYVPEDLTFLTYSFLHQDFWHLASNMIFLWVFGDNVEDAMGHIRYIVFYIACAAAGAFFHGIVTADADTPLIGASGAISGIVAAYLMLHPRVRVWVLILFRFPVPLPAFIPLAFWVLQQFYYLVTDTDRSISWGAHAGGIIAGAILVTFMRRRGVLLFDRGTPASNAVAHADGSAASPAPGEKPEEIKWGRN